MLFSPEHAFSLDFSMIATAGFIGTAFAFLFVDFFDTAGIISVANLTGKVNKKGEVDGIDRALLADSAATSAGALVGTSNTTSYIESGAGIQRRWKDRTYSSNSSGIVCGMFVFCPTSTKHSSFCDSTH